MKAQVKLIKDVNAYFAWPRLMKFNVILDRDEDGVWIVECPSIPGCVSQGETREKALENIKDAIALCLQVLAERGLPAYG